MVDIDRLLRGPEPHPFRKEFEKYDVSHAKLAAYLGFSQQIVSKWLGGYKPMPREVEETMRRIIDELEKREKNQQGKGA